MSALFDIIIGFITALVSAAFLHFGAGSAPSEPAKPAPAPQVQPTTTTTTETTVTTEVVTTDEAKPEAVTLSAKAPRADSVHKVQVKVRAPVSVAHVDPKMPVAPVDMLAVPPAPPAPPAPPVALPALPALTLRIAGLSIEEQKRIAAEVENDLRAAQLEVALEIAAQQDEIRAAAEKVAAEHRLVQHHVAVRVNVSEDSGPCPDAQAAPLPAHIRTIVAQ